MVSLIQIVMVLAGAALILDTLFVASRHTLNTGVVLPAILGMPLLLWGIARNAVLSWLPAVVRPVDILLATGFIIFTASFLTVICLILRAPSEKVPPVVDILIVLGAALKGESISRTLDRRLGKSAEILRQHPKLPVIVSGGQCAGGTRSEASAMAEYLERSGIDRNRIILEDQSGSTVQNLLHCRPLIEAALGRHPRLVAIVTSDYHVYRALLMARRLGYDAIGIAAPTARDNWINNLLREYAGLIRYLLFGT